MSDDRFLSVDIVGRQKSAVVGRFFSFVCHRLNEDRPHKDFLRTRSQGKGRGLNVRAQGQGLKKSLRNPE